MADIDNIDVNNSISQNDLLAFERTKMAVERTLLAYIRTSLTFFVASLSLIQFFENRTFVIAGYFLMPVGFILLVVGFMRHSNLKKTINEMIS